jgi:cytochrome P450
LIARSFYRLTHLDPSIYPRPDHFDPDRFADTQRRRQLQRDCAYVQFGFGLHRCLGEMFANAVLKPSWSLLLRHYELTLVEECVPPPDWSKSLGTPFPVRPVRVRVKRR